MGVDKIYLGKTQKFLTVVSNLETGEPLWFGKDRKEKTLNETSKDNEPKLCHACKVGRMILILLVPRARYAPPTPSLDSS